MGIKMTKPRLYKAAEQGNLELVEDFLDEGDDPNQTDENEMSPLHAIVLSNPLFEATPIKTRIEIVEALLEAKAEVDQKDVNGRTPLYYAASGYENELIELLLKNKAQVGVTDSLGETALHAATHFEVGGAVDCAKTIELLLKAGSNLDQHSAVGFSPRNNILFSGRKDLQALVESQAVAVIPTSSKAEKGLASLLLQFSNLLNVDRGQKSKLATVLERADYSSNSDLKRNSFSPS